MTMQINSFPRSGNFYLYNLLRANAINVKPVSHFARNLENGNCLVILRNPVEAISSWVAFSKTNVEDAIKFYNRFHQKLIDYFDRNVIICFEYLKSDCSNFLQKIFDKPIYNIIDINKNATPYSYSLFDESLFKSPLEIYRNLMDMMPNNEGAIYGKTL